MYFTYTDPTTPSAPSPICPLHLPTSITSQPSLPYTPLPHKSPTPKSPLVSMSSPTIQSLIIFKSPSPSKPLQRVSLAPMASNQVCYSLPTAPHPLHSMAIADLHCPPPSICKNILLGSEESLLQLLSGLLPRETSPSHPPMLLWLDEYPRKRSLPGKGH